MHQISIQYLYYNNHVKDSVRTDYIESCKPVQAAEGFSAKGEPSVQAHEVMGSRAGFLVWGRGL
jgi:hypothetical protein